MKEQGHCGGPVFVFFKRKRILKFRLPESFAKKSVSSI